MFNLVSKIVAKIKYPELQLFSTRPERKLFRKEQAKIEWLVRQTLQDSNEN